MTKEKVLCPRCGSPHHWNIRRGKKKCKACRHEYSHKFAGLNLRTKEINEILRWFVLEQSVASIHEQTKVSRYRIMKILTSLREAMAKDIPDVFEGIIEVDETYVGGAWKNKGKEDKES